jgi:hypothetical protein
MKRARFILVAVLAIASIVVAFQAYFVNSTTTPALSFAPSSSGKISYPNPVNPNVTLTGPLTSTVVSPTCVLSSHPCAISGGTLYYITVNGVNYRLIFPASMKLPISGLHIMVTGTYVTPSTYQSSQWTPELYFGGDVYVMSYSYVFTYPFILLRMPLSYV